MELSTKWWNGQLGGHVKAGRNSEAMQAYRLMCLHGCRPNHLTLVFLLSACSRLRNLQQGRLIHDLADECGYSSDVFVQTAAVTMYAKCGSLLLAAQALERMHTRNVVSWNALISANAQSGHFEQAIALYKRMDVEPDAFTYSAVLRACGESMELVEGRRVHNRIVLSGARLDVAAQNALVSMYASCGDAASARRVFDGMERKDVISWNAMIAGYARKGLCREAMQLFWEMLNNSSIVPDEVSVASALAACAAAVDLAEGRRVHRYAAAAHSASRNLQNCVVSFYARCGSITEARAAFDGIRSKDVFSWNALMAASPLDEQEVFLQQLTQEGLHPVGATYTSILHSCSQMGLLSRAWEHFSSLSGDYMLVPVAEHYRCMLDLLARNGLLEEAELVLESMPFQPGHIGWKTMLAACKLHGDAKRAADVSSRVTSSVMSTPSYSVLLSSMYRDVT